MKKYFFLVIPIVTIIIVTSIIVSLLAPLPVSIEIAGLTVITVSSLFVAFNYTNKKAKIKLANIVADINKAQKGSLNPIIMLNKKRQIIGANNSILEFLGYEEQELLGKKIDEICAGQHSRKEKNFNCILRAKSNEPIEIDCEFWTINIGDSEVTLIIFGNSGYSKLIEAGASWHSITVIKIDNEKNIVDVEGAVLDAFDLNGVYESKRDLIGKNMLSIANFDNLDLNVKTTEKQLINVVTLSNTKKTFSNYAIVHKDYMLLAFQDITKAAKEKLTIEKALKRYQTIANIAPIGMIVTNSNLVVKETNSYLSALFSSGPAKELVGKKISDIPGLKETKIEEAAREAIITGEPSVRDCNFFSEFGITASLTYTVSLIKDEDKIMSVFILVEVRNRSS